MDGENCFFALCLRQDCRAILWSGFQSGHESAPAGSFEQLEEGEESFQIAFYVL